MKHSRKQRIRQETLAYLVTAIYVGCNSYHHQHLSLTAIPVTNAFRQQQPPQQRPTTIKKNFPVEGLFATVENERSQPQSSKPSLGGDDDYYGLSSTSTIPVASPSSSSLRQNYHRGRTTAATATADVVWSPEIQVLPFQHYSLLSKQEQQDSNNNGNYRASATTAMELVEAMEPFYAVKIPSTKMRMPSSPAAGNNNSNGAAAATTNISSSLTTNKNGATTAAAVPVNGKMNGVHRRSPPKVDVTGSGSGNNDDDDDRRDLDQMDCLSDFDGGSSFRSRSSIVSDYYSGGGQQVHAEAIPELRSWEGAFVVPDADDGVVVQQAENLNNATSSRAKRVYRAVRKTLKRMSPIRIFGSPYYYDEWSATAKTFLNATQASFRRQTQKRQQSKEEAMVKRMSRKKKKQLSNLLRSVNRLNTKSMAGITARTLTGFLSALAEEAENLSVRMNAREDTPLWRKQIDSVSIEFTRLGFKPLHMGGPDQQLLPKKKEEAVGSNKNNSQKKTSSSQTARNVVSAARERLHFPQRLQLPKSRPQALVDNNDDDGFGVDDTCPVEIIDNPMAAISCADTAFQQIDVDNSGSLDKDEIAKALALAASASSSAVGSSNDTTNSFSAAASNVGDSSRKAFQRLAKQLVDLYDTNDDGVIDRKEYQSMVEDMAALRKVQKEREQKQRQDSYGENNNNGDDGGGGSWWSSVLSSVWRNNNNSPSATTDNDGNDLGEAIIGKLQGQSIVDISKASVADDILGITESVLATNDETPETMGKIEFENLKIDLRQIAFGAIPILKHITPGGPLFLEPFKVTITGSFSAEDIMKSSLLDAGLRQLVSFALRVRVRSFRDLVDGAVFYGRKWKRSSAKAPLVECTELTKVEIDDKDRIIITGRAKVRASFDAPVIDQSFKLRTKVATPRNGRAIKLSEPEIAIVIECPKQWEKNMNSTFAKLKMRPPPKPKPIYTYIPIHSPFKKDDATGGYYMGEDNQIKSMYIKDKCLRFEMEAILRPGRFLGSHYLAFTVPQRALIITVDRVKEGMRAARRRKKTLRALRKARAVETNRKAHNAADALTLDGIEEDLVIVKPSAPFTGNKEEILDDDDEEKPKDSSAKAFISRFVDGYVQAGADEENKVKLAHAISDWFGRQGISDSRISSNDNSAAGIESPRPGNAISNVIEDIALEQTGD